MSNSLRYDIATARLSYSGRHEPTRMSKEKVSTFNLRHQEVLGFYGLELADGTVFTIDDSVNGKSNLGVFRSKQLRQAVILAAALPAVAVALDGLGSLKKVPEEQQSKQLINRLKRHNDRTAAQVMSEVLQITTETFDRGEEVIIQSSITEGVRVKPGVEAGGNPTIPVGALYGKEEHCSRYGRGLSKEVTMLSMGSDVIDGTGKSVKGIHSSLTALFITESGFKRHLPDIYVERWLAGAYFPEFNPRDTDIREEARIIADAYGGKDFSEMTAFFLDRPRHHPAMDQLNAIGVATPYDKDGDLFPALVMGLEGLRFPDGRGLYSMIGEIGGSAEWTVGALPLVWRGGQGLGMLTSQSSLTRKDLSPEDLWNERFHYTEEELILLQDARFEQKPFFTVYDLMERPFAGGVSAFAAISDNYYLPQLEGVKIDREKGLITTNTLMINSLGNIEHWQLIFRAPKGLDTTAYKMKSPKTAMNGLNGPEIEEKIRAMADDEIERFRLKHFFVNEYYPAIIHTAGKMVVLRETVEALIKRGALSGYDRDVVSAMVKAFPEWFTSAA
ncbi:MAG: fructose-bisphosphatase class II [Deltaproteobacteria bacterium]|nr:fructose-bisphosphatase class II [Deltaproteobacteria bacterium]MBW2071935.1 fructose-bisphosphatase class II [Deltaproteobacteria bacterium]